MNYSINLYPIALPTSLLIKNGYLQSGFAEKNGLGQQYVTGVVKNNANGQPALQALTCSVQGDTFSEKGMRRIAAQITGMGGFVDEKNIASGAYSSWTRQPMDFGPRLPQRAYCHCSIVGNTRQRIAGKRQAVSFSGETVSASDIRL